MSSPVARERRLDELVLEVLAAQQPPADDSEIAVTTQFVKLSLPYEKVEIDFEPGPVTPVRTRRTTFVRTVRARETLRDFPVPSLPADTDAASTVTMPQFAHGTGPVPAAAGPALALAAAAQTRSLQAAWFDKSEDSLSRMLAAEQQRRARQWLWLAISVIVAAVATLVLI